VPSTKVIHLVVVVVTVWKPHVFHRRGDCVNLKACEEAFLEVHGCEDAECPKGCKAFLEAERFVEPVSIPSTLTRHVRSNKSRRRDAC